MLLPSLHSGGGDAQAWSVARAAAYGAVVGALAALFKTFGPLRGTGLGARSASENLLASLPEIAGAALAFALLFAAAAALRNFIVRRLV